MVQSILDPSINYEEIKNLAKDDKNFDAVVFKYKTDGNEFFLAIGQAKYAFEGANIIYFPIYLILSDDSVGSRVGIFEILESQYPSIMDEEGDVDEQRLGKPLFFSYASELFKEMITDEATDHITDQLAILTVDKSTGYDPTKATFWVQKYLKNNDYKIVDNEGGGDCLFAVIRDAMISTSKGHQELDVEILRTLLASEATEQIYQNYKDLYNNIFSNLDKLEELNKQRLLLITRNKEIKEQFKISKDKDIQDRLKSEASKIVEQYKEIVKDIKEQNKSDPEMDVTREEHSYLLPLKNVNSLDQFKEYIKTCQFWGESWAISTLERVLNVKLILLSEEQYERGRLDNVVYCGDETDLILKQAGIFKPELYIILDHNGYHYKLITYKGQRIFKFSKLPTKIKDIIKLKCYPNQVGSYYLIEELRNYKSEDEAKPEDKSKETEDKSKETQDKSKETEDKSKETQDKSKETQDKSKDIEGGQKSKIRKTRKSNFKKINKKSRKK